MSESACEMRGWRFPKCRRRWYGIPRRRVARHHRPGRCRWSAPFFRRLGVDAFSKNQARKDWGGGWPREQCSSLFRLPGKDARTSRWGHPCDGIPRLVRGLARDLSFASMITRAAKNWAAGPLRVASARTRARSKSGETRAGAVLEVSNWSSPCWAVLGGLPKRRIMLARVPFGGSHRISRETPWSQVLVHSER